MLLVHEALHSAEVEPKSHEALKGEAKWGGGDDVKPAYQSVKLVSS